MRAGRSIGVRGAAAALLITGMVAFGAASPAFADEVVIEHPPAGVISNCFVSTVRGQTFTATAPGHLTEVGYWVGSTSGHPTISLELRVRADGQGGAVLASQDVTFQQVVTGQTTLQSFTLDTPVPVEAGEVYAFEISDGGCGVGLLLAENPSDYPGGAGYTAFLPRPDQTFRLVISTPDSDSDGDGVADSADRCADTTFTASPDKLKKNKYWSPSADGFVDGTGKVAYTLADTGGCSAEQIIEAAGLGVGHVKNGLSIGELRAWVASAP